MLFSRELARRLEGTGVTAFALHPGVVATRIAQDGDTRIAGYLWKAAKPFQLSPDEGAQTSVFVATEPGLDLHSGGYFSEARLAPVSEAAQDAVAARRLWATSERLTGCQFPAIDMTVRISNPDRVLFPENGITKADLAAHVERFAERTLPHVEGRPLTLERYPKGIAETGFMQKNMPKGLPGVVERCAVPKRNGETVHPMVNTRDGLAYLANLATISLHAPTARCDDLRLPDRIVFDLDPPPGDTRVADAARTLRTFLGDLGLATVPLATGSKGYHLVAFITAVRTVR